MKSLMTVIEWQITCDRMIGIIITHNIFDKFFPHSMLVLISVYLIQILKRIFSLKGGSFKGFSKFHHVGHDGMCCKCATLKKRAIRWLWAMCLSIQLYLLIFFTLSLTRVLVLC